MLAARRHGRRLVCLGRDLDRRQRDGGVQGVLRRRHAAAARGALPRAAERRDAEARRGRCCGVLPAACCEAVEQFMLNLRILSTGLLASRRIGSGNVRLRVGSRHKHDLWTRSFRAASLQCCHGANTLHTPFEAHLARRVARGLAGSVADDVVGRRRPARGVGHQPLHVPTAFTTCQV